MAHGDGPCRLLGQQVERPCGGFAEGEREILRVVGNEVKLGLFMWALLGVHLSLKKRMFLSSECREGITHMKVYDFHVSEEKG